jgi:hypothetical protein
METQRASDGEREQPHGHPPSYVRAALTSTDFQSQPRHVQLLVCFIFPVYAGLRLAWTTAIESARLSLRTGKNVLGICKQTFDVCKHIYNYLAPRVWRNFVRPYVLRPVLALVVEPVVRLAQGLFDLVASVLEQLCATLRGYRQVQESESEPESQTEDDEQEQGEGEEEEEEEEELHDEEEKDNE